MILDQEAAPSEPAEPAPRYRWYHKLAGLCFVIFCFELGVFLLVFPWVTPWDMNYIASVSPSIHKLWTSPYFRGALSGLGLVNIYLSLIEVFRLRRFSMHE